MSNERSRFSRIRRVRGASADQLDDRVAVEEPLEIRILGKPVSVVMRTPGDDADLAVGFVVTEGLCTFDDISAAAACVDAKGAAVENVMNVSLIEGAAARPEIVQRNFYVTSSCGVCGKATLDAVNIASPPVDANIKITRKLLSTISEKCIEKQTAFAATGGIHAACLFDTSGNLLIIREDVGRHNAVDKIVGSLVRARKFPPENCILWVSGRAAFEIIQKARIARIAIVVSVGAPTSLAIDCARDGNMTLVGFLRNDGFNIYSGGERVEG
ncbi:MAG: formate dehydrogenase accessory sulfurtransferase FdhD [Planctomycetota bacterium]